MNKIDLKLFRAKLISELGLHVVGIGLTILLLIPFLRLHRMDWNYPIALHEAGDGTYYAMLIKILVETGWVYHHPDLGAPFGLDLYDFAHFDSLHLLIMKGLTLFSSNWVTILNLYFLLGFPLTTVTSFIFFRSLRWNPWLCLLLALLFTLQPYHLHRGQGHLMLGSYFLIPLQFLPVIWLLSPQGLANSNGNCYLNSPRLVSSLLITFVAVFAGHYYTAFAWLGVLIASIHRAVIFQSIRSLVYPFVFLLIIMMAFIINLTPNIIYWYNQGMNRVVSAKPHGMVEHYGLKLVSTLLPSNEHPLTFLQNLRKKYESYTPLKSSNTCSIGFAASFGLVAALGFGLFAINRNSLITSVGVVLLGLILFCTLSGFGAIFAYLITPQLHGLGRVSIVLALLGLLSLGQLIHQLQTKAVFGRYHHLILSLFGCFMIFDLYPARPIYHPSQMKHQFKEHQDFAYEISKVMPRGSTIHQMPITSFPFVGNFGYYQAIPYLFTDGYRWTYPPMLNRRGLAWCERLEQLPPEQMLQELAKAGVDGLILDTQFREGTGWLREPPYSIAWTRTQDLYCYLLSQGVQPVVVKSDQVFFDLRVVLQRYREKLLRESAKSYATEIQPTTIMFLPKWSYVRPSDQEGWSRNRQCSGGSASLDLINHTSRSLDVCFRFVLQDAEGSATQCKVQSPLFPAKPWIVGLGLNEIRFVLPPGRHCVEFQSLQNDKKARLRLILDQIALDVVDSESIAKR